MKLNKTYRRAKSGGTCSSCEYHIKPPKPKHRTLLCGNLKIEGFKAHRNCTCDLHIKKKEEK